MSLALSRRLATAASAIEPKAPLILSAQDAKRLFISSPRTVKLLDTTWFMPATPRDAKREFIERRLSTAQFWDLDQIASPHPLGLKHMMPTGEMFQNACCEHCCPLTQ
jgi:thiosulfate/3-mercaptopyruvate sulfurtransferase